MVIRNFNPLVRHSLSTGRRWELVALTRDVMSLVACSTFPEVARLTHPALRVREPWASGVALIRRDDPVTRVVSIDSGHLLVFGVDGDRQIERFEVQDSDLDLISILWVLSYSDHTAASREEAYRCLVLLSALGRGIPPDHFIRRWVHGDLSALAAELDVPAGWSNRELYALAHAAELQTFHPGQSCSDDEALNSLLTVVPPRWVIADQFRKEGRADLFDLLMYPPVS